MANEQRVVIRSSWLAVFATTTAPVLVVFLVAQIWQRSLGGAITVLFVVSVMTALLHATQFIELTAYGLTIHRFGLTSLPWSQIGSIEIVRSLGGSDLRVEDLARDRGHRLSAPRAAFGVGGQKQEKARDLIEQWWVAYRRSPPPVAARPESPPAEASGPPIDPWAPPREG